MTTTTTTAKTCWPRNGRVHNADVGPAMLSKEAARRGATVEAGGFAHDAQTPRGGCGVALSWGRRGRPSMAPAQSTAWQAQSLKHAPPATSTPCLLPWGPPRAIFDPPSHALYPSPPSCPHPPLPASPASLVGCPAPSAPHAYSVPVSSCPLRMLFSALRSANRPSASPTRSPCLEGTRWSVTSCCRGRSCHGHARTNTYNNSLPLVCPRLLCPPVPPPYSALPFPSLLCTFRLLVIHPPQRWPPSILRLHLSLGRC